MKRISIDIAYDTLDDFKKTLSEINKAGLSYKVINFNGPAAGWPDVDIMGSEDRLRPMIDKISGDDQYYDEFVEEVSF